VTGTRRRRPTGWLPRVLGAPRPPVTSGLPALCPRCRSTSRRASALETPDVGAHMVVFVDVEGYQPADGRDAVERVEEEPLMLQGAPPRLDHRVREPQLREGEQPAEHARGEQFVDLRVDVLHARVRHHHWGPC
jgi:hypothetical protein